MISQNSRVAVILPCYNEETAIANVIAGFQASVPHAKIYVFDNNSTDRTAEIARAAGAIVRPVLQQGKGNVMRQAFAKVDADIYVVADGDGTYDTTCASDLVNEMTGADLDMVVGVRKHQDRASYRPGHVIGNWLFNQLVLFIYQHELRDIFSGYRVLSRAFVKSFPALATGFETEAEMSLHAIQLKLPFREIDTDYRPRGEGSSSKLNTFSDGFRILYFLISMLKYVRPMYLFSIVAAFFAILSLTTGLPVVAEYLHTGLVPRFPTAIAAAALMVIATISFVTGVLLDSVAHSLREQKRLAYLAVSTEYSRPSP
ncbi:MAG: glycosyltransferase [Pseudomonadota bacterium]